MAALSQARRPLIVAGGGVLRESQTAALAELADRSGIPVACLQLSPDAFPTTHSKALGILGRNGWETANHAARQADVIVAIGAHIDYYSTMFGYGVFNREAKIIHHNTAPNDVGVVYPVAQAISGSTRSFIAGLTRRVRASGQTWEWLDVASSRAAWETERNAPAEAVDPIRGAFVAKAMRKTLPPNGMMVVDAGNAGKHLRPMYDTYEPGTFLMIDDWASVGGSFPIALGARLARPDRPVMVTVGDMGMMCNIGEMETAVRENIPVVAVVFNDDGLGNERAFQNELYGGRLFAVDYGTVDFGAVARALGGHGERVTAAADLEGALQRALASGRPAIVDVAIDKSFLASVVLR
jgi:thiamine pyrophosphate-dependent acetolactate synthase large subunit-like protein